MSKTVAEESLDINLDLLVHIGEELKTQDNAMTAEPMVTVQQKRRDYGYSEDYADGIEWYHRDEGLLVEDPKARRLETLHGHGREPYEDKYGRVGYKDRWEHVQTFFTIEAATNFCQTQAHNLAETRIYIESSHRNREWKALLKIMEQAPALLKAVQTLAAVSELALAPEDPHKPVNTTYKLGVIREMLTVGDKPLFAKETKCPQY